MCLNFLVWFCLLAVLMCGCARRSDPLGHQVSRATDAGLRGQELLSEGEHRQAEKAFSKSLRINRSIDDPIGAARQLNNLAALALTRGDLPEAKNLFQQALFVNQGLGNDAGAAINLANLATIAQKGGDLPKAERYLEEARNLARLSGLAKIRGQVLCQMAGLALDRQDPGTAAVLLEEAQPSAHLAEVQGSWNYQQGRLSLARGDTVNALSFFQAALAADRSILNRPGMGADLQGLGQVWEAQGDFSRSFLYYSRAFDLYAATSSHEKAQLCLDVLRRLNKVGRLGHSLKPYEQQLAASKAAAAPCPPPAKTTEPSKDPTRPEELTTAPPQKDRTCSPAPKKSDPEKGRP
jgi:tetratricopeptide (TPR) repeat protein